MGTREFSNLKCRRNWYRKRFHCARFQRHGTRGIRGYIEPNARRLHTRD